MADYSGYAPQRQQQRQDPWADAAVGIAKLFMPDQETQIKMGQLRQQNDINQLRLRNADAESKAADARAIYDAERIGEANVQRALNEERSKILAEAARTGGLTVEQAGRLAELNARLGKDGAVADIYKLTPEGKAAEKAAAKAKADAAAAKAAAEAQAAAEKERKKVENEALAAREKADDEYFSGEAKKAKEYQAPADLDLRNAIVAEVYSLTRGRTLSEADINLIIRSARKKKLRGSAEEIASTAVRQALGNDNATAASRLDNVATPQEIEALKKSNPSAVRDIENARRFKEDAFKAIENLPEGQAPAIVVEGTPEEIRAKVASSPPGTRVIWRDTTTGRYGGGMVPPATWSMGPSIVPQNQRVLGYFAPWQR